jgi:hypothetical protein
LTWSPAAQETLRYWLDHDAQRALVRKYEAGYRRTPEGLREIKAAGAAAMTTSRKGHLTPIERVEDLPRILKAMTEAGREALLRHKRLGNPVAVWRDGRVVWLRPEEIPTDIVEPGREGA